MNATGALRHFIEQQLTTSNPQRFGLGEDVSSEHLASHLVEQTVGRAALDVATERHPSTGAFRPSSAPISWKHALMIAALTELRSFKLMERR